MANNKIQVKRTTVSGRQPNTTGSYATNSQYIAAGEFALNMADGILFSSNGSAVIEIGANNTNQNVTGNLTVKAIIANGSIGANAYVLASNGAGVYWTTPTYGSLNYAQNAAPSIYSNAQVATTLAQITITTSGNPVQVIASGDANPLTTGGWGRIQLYRGSTPIGAQTHFESSNANENVPYALQFIDAPASGTYTYALKLNYTTGNTQFGETDGPVISAVELQNVKGNDGNANLNATYTWNNTHTFSANVSFNDDIALTTNNALYFNGISDGNWRIARNSNNVTKWIYTGNTIDILTANTSNEGFTIGLNGNTSYFETGYLGTYIRNTVTVGNTSSNATINSTAFTGTSNNTSYVGSITAANVVSNAQLSSNLSNYVTTTNLTNNLANYQTTAGLSANVALLAANAATYLGNSSGTIANVASWITTNAAAAYTNSVSYTDSKILTANAAITGNAATAYTNAVSYVDGKSYVNTSQLSNNLSNYALLSGATFTGNVVANNANTTYDLNVGRNLTVAGNLTITGNVTVIGANTFSIVDNMFYLNSNNTTQNVDLGFAGNYNDGTYHHTGFFRDATDGVWKVFDNYDPEPDAAVNIDTTNTSFHIANFQANTLYLGNTSTNWFVSNTSGIYHTGIVNAATFSVGSSITANSSEFVIGTAVGVQANGSLGTAGQVLTSNATTVYWANVSNASASMIRQAYTGDGSTTVFTVTGGYTANELDVYLNGVKLLNGTDVTVTSGTTFTITPAPMNGSTIYAVGYRATTITTIDAVLKAGDTMTGNLVVGNTTIGLNSITVGNSSVNTTVNSTIFTGTANNTLFVGSVSAANVVSNAQLQANLSSKASTGKAIAMAIVFGG